MNENTPLCESCKKNPGTVVIQQRTPVGDTDDLLCKECAIERSQKQTPSFMDAIMDTVNIIFESHDQFRQGPPDNQPNKKGFSSFNQRSVLDNYCTDITKEALNGFIDPVVGRSAEIQRVINILNRRTKNNPVLIGEPGVGKTAIIEGLALKIVEGSVPAKLRHKKIMSLDITAVTGGTMYHGMFQDRMNKIIKEVEQRNDIILFVDEMHLIMGAGSSMDNNMDAANILKPYLAKGKIQMIGATTLEEFREIEKDTAFSRRYQPITVKEPTLDETFEILKGLKNTYEEYHGVLYSDDVLKACVNIADRYIFERFMPDKAIDLMDEVGARLNLKRNPPNQTDEKAIYDILDQERIAAEEERYEEAMKLKQKRLALESKHSGQDNLYEATIAEIKEIAQDITGIPVTDLSISDKDGLLNLTQRLSKSVIGQDKAIEHVVRAVKRNRANLRNKTKPTSFLFAGPTGVGKTELTKQLAIDLFGSEQSLIRFDMSEFMESHSVSKLIGSPPGYVGHENAGKLTEQVRRRPYSVILLDEIEKAHRDVANVFLQVFNDGRLTDAQGKTVDFSHTIIIMTSNLGSDKPKTTGFNVDSESTHFLDAINGFFKPEFINRIDAIVPFNSLSKELILPITQLMIDSLSSSLKENNIDLELEEGVLNWLVDKGYNEKYGARPLYRTITKYIEDLVTDYVLENTDPSLIVVSLNDDKTNTCIRQ